MTENVEMTVQQLNVMTIIVQDIFLGEEALMTDKTHYHLFFLDVGQGSSTLVIKRDIKNNGNNVQCSTLLVDCHKGDDNQVDSVALIKDTLPKSIKEGKEIITLDSMVITHPHKDHIKGLDSFVNDTDLNVCKIFHPDYDFIEDKDTADFKAYKKLRKDSSSQTETRVISGRTYGEDTGISFIALSPPQDIENSDKFKDQPEKIQVHNQSVALRIEANGLNILILGDANQECINRILSYHQDQLEADILVASHHGSNSIFVPEMELEDAMASIERNDEKAGWSEEFLTKIDPSYVIISCGKDNSYKHPHSAALQAYQDNERTVKRTDLDGTLHAIIDENGACEFQSIKDLETLKETIKNLFPENAQENDSVKRFFIGGSSLPVAPRNA